MSVSKYSVNLKVFLVALLYQCISCDVIYFAIGNLTHSSLTIKSKSQKESNISLILNSLEFPIVVPDADGYTTHQASGLTPNTTYSISFKLNNQSHLNTNGTITTMVDPMSPFTFFRFIVTSNSNSDSNKLVYNRMADLRPNFLMLLGNLNKDETCSDKWTDYEKAYLKSLTNTNQKKVYNNIPLVYTFNDYDFCGKNSNSDSKGLSSIHTTYRKMFPSYNLESTSGLYHSFKHSGVLFLVTDTRSYLSVSEKTYYGETQKAWLKDQISKAASDITTRGIIITSTQVWTYNQTVYQNNFIKQDYLSLNSAFDTDKKEIGDAITNSGINFQNPGKPGYKPILMVIGEEMLSFDNGKNNQFGGFPSVVCGNIDGSGTCKGGPHSHASFTQEDEQFCHIIAFTNVTDISNPKLCFNITGMIRKVDGEDITQDQPVFFYNTCYGHEFKGAERQCPIGTPEKLINFAITFGINIFLFLIFFIALYRLSTKSFNYQLLEKNE